MIEHLMQKSFYILLNQWRIYDHPIRLKQFYRLLNPKYELLDRVHTDRERELI